MTIAEYINQKLQAFGVTDAQLADFAMDSGLDPSTEYTSANRMQVWKTMCQMIEELCLAPYQKSINEAGFSTSWDVQNLGKYYIYLCGRCGISVKPDMLQAIGISAIIDKSDIW